MTGVRPFLFLSANTPWVYALARSLSVDRPVTAVRLYDWLNYVRIRPVWPDEDPGVRRVTWSLPPGYAGRAESLFRPLIQGLIALEQEKLRRLTGREPLVVAPYPYLAPWLRQVLTDALVYYNLDEYTLYDPSKAKRTLELEQELVERARLTLCLSKHQVAILASRVPTRADRIQHFPLGVEENLLNLAPDASPLPNAVGYVGNLGDRVDWELVLAVADELPQTDFHFVGFAHGPKEVANMMPWQRTRKTVFERPNVHYCGGVPQQQVREHYWRYAVNWMPYAVDHPFNVAACPTKIMDAIASGRPFVATPTPEVALYPEHIATGENVADLVRVLSSALREPFDGAAAVEFARSNVWPRRAEELRSILELN